MSLGGQAARAGEAAGGGAAAMLFAAKLAGGVRALFRTPALREVSALRVELAPVLADLKAAAKVEREWRTAEQEWREKVEGDLGCLAGAVSVLLDGKPVPGEAQTRRRRRL